MTDNIRLFHVNNIGWGEREYVLPTGLCPNSHLEAHDSMEGTLKARELDGDCGGAQLVVKVRSHVDSLSGDNCFLQIVWSIHYYTYKQQKSEKSEKSHKK